MLSLCASLSESWSSRMSLGGVRWLCSTVGSYAGTSDFADVQFSCVVASFPKRDPLLEAGGKGSVFAECTEKKAGAIKKERLTRKQRMRPSWKDAMKSEDMGGCSERFCHVFCYLVFLHQGFVLIEVIGDTGTIQVWRPPVRPSAIRGKTVRSRYKGV